MSFLLCHCTHYQMSITPFTNYNYNFLYFRKETDLYRSLQIDYFLPPLLLYLLAKMAIILVMMWSSWLIHLIIFANKHYSSQALCQIWSTLFLNIINKVHRDFFNSYSYYDYNWKRRCFVVTCFVILGFKDM